MKEEKVTISIIKHLRSHGWKILAFDFPQSGTGISFHPNNEDRKSTKNKGSIIPDIICYKDECCIFFENKDKLVLSDYKKINIFITGRNYSEALAEFYEKHKINPTQKTAIGLPKKNCMIKNIPRKSVNYTYLVTENLEVEIIEHF